MEVSVYGSMPPQNDELLEQQIEEKEKILAKMLNLESLSIKSSVEKTIEHVEKTDPVRYEPEIHTTVYVQGTPAVDTPRTVKEVRQAPKKTDPGDLVPKVVKLPNTWNLENIELRLDVKHGATDAANIISPDDNLDSEWEVI